MLGQSAIIATIAVACLVLTNLLNGPAQLIVVLFVFAAAAIAVLLYLAYSFIAGLNAGIWTQDRPSMLAHIVLHIVPVSYVAVQSLIGTTLLINAIYLLPIMLFFYTGRRTWAEMFKQFGRKMYRIYYFGNTALLRACPVLLAFGFLVDESIGTEAFRRAMLAYCSIHFLLSGLTMISIEKDLSAGVASVRMPN
ncbi:MAG: hypothetical protein WBX11_01520 [Thiobacillaceae bacterium]